MNRKTARLRSTLLAPALLCSTLSWAEESPTPPPAAQVIAAEETPLLTERENVQRFIERMVSKHQFEREPLSELLNQLTLREKKISPKTSAAKRKAKMDNPAESRPWAEYRGKHVKPGIINRGVKFWKLHEETLAKAEAEYGVPVHIIMGVLGVETRYGGYMGKNPVINALATFAFNYPKRERFFTSELEAFLLLAREEKQDPFSYRGSYAGAMGMPQFMPSNYRKLAVDYDQDGKKDIWHTPADAIGSIANYLRHHGWKPGKPIATPARYLPTTPSTEHQVASGDSLWTIAQQVQSQQGGSMGGIMTQLQQINPSAFINNNPNQIKLGATLKLPVAKEAGYKHLILKKLRPKFQLQQILDNGFQIEPNYPTDAKALLLELKGEKGIEHWVALHNFYVISRYNPRTLYTMAVFQLGEEINKAYHAEKTVETKPEITLNTNANPT
ncbi:MAG: LysM peptidoglycan-binding domain-containing protein [Gammaproteobacteria bacterium]|jgi:membrane-bound lytic murein transglycosylase B|nr:LysM peptidoglycan-binding domain-containing protein [Gammaproteobacteria bacterium]MBT3968106.1 LysM peptidoglycan-binding domain-containing protein [Gammaproteobacteria bacterium]MBT4328853.1 LysM peptidoglycan-binding domain-containing protein [Gammaproteobacteria bacterium]MBT6078846.1 LysM peptidoglycan-binding domain-containing protein [Gammaproteobacteria bacterium]MBT7022792.1 LysM peptidoglycan-binding domain-containing protein [Gammaproteobacteria bacterium]